MPPLFPATPKRFASASGTGGAASGSSSQAATATALGKRFLLGPHYLLAGDVEARWRRLNGSKRRFQIVAANRGSIWPGRVPTREVVDRQPPWPQTWDIRHAHGGARPTGGFKPRRTTSFFARSAILTDQPTSP